MKLLLIKPLKDTWPENIEFNRRHSPGQIFNTCEAPPDAEIEMEQAEYHIAFWIKTASPYASPLEIYIMEAEHFKELPDETTTD